MGGDSLGDGPYGIALIYRADCNLNQAHGAQFAAWAARVAAYERLADYAADAHRLGSDCRHRCVGCRQVEAGRVVVVIRPLQHLVSFRFWFCPFSIQFFY